MKVISENKVIEVDSSLAEEIRRRSGENVSLCYQCKKCASGCPGRMFMDSTPTELMKYVQLGMIDEKIAEAKSDEIKKELKIKKLEMEKKAEIYKLKMAEIKEVIQKKKEKKKKSESVEMD